MAAPSSVSADMGRRVGHSLRRAQQALRAAMDAALRAEGVTTPQYAALKQISAEPGLSSAELARRTFVTPQTMQEVVAGLEATALVARSPHPQGGRRLEVALTALGRRTLERCDAVVERVEERLVRGMEESQVATLQTALQLCVQNLEGARSNVWR
jgi:DNA-binding MarR family transcriptional regulator